MRPIETPTYQKIADVLRAEIQDGTHARGEFLPTVVELAARFQVSTRTIVEANKLLLNEGLLVGKPGARTRVRAQPDTIRLVRSWRQDAPSGSPWRAAMAAVGRVGDWESHSTPASAPPAVAARLGIEAGAQTMRTTYTFTADGEPAYLSVSWEPMAITAGSPILLPESGPCAGLGVVDRMAVIGRVVTLETHEIVPHVLTDAEATALGLRAGTATVMKIRTYLAGDVPVETAEIVLPAHVVTRYEIPVGRALEA